MVFLYLTLLIISPQDWFGPLLGLPVDYLLYPLWLAAVVFTGRARYLLRFTWQDGFFAAFLAWMTLSAFANAAAGVSTEHLFFYSKWFVLYKLVGASLSSGSRLRRVGLALVLLALVLAAESIQQMHDPAHLGWAGQTLGWISASAMAEGVPGRTRWVSIFDGPGVFCVVFTLALPFLLVSLDRCYPAHRRFAAAVALPPLALAIYYTGSRGGFLTTLAILGMHFGARTKISPMKLAAVGVILALLFAAAPAYLTQLHDPERSSDHRVDVWMQGLEMVRQNPLFGVGRGHYADYTGTLIAHNSAIELAAELGLPGFFFWAALIYLGFKQVWLARRTSEDDQERAYATALGICLAGYMVSSMFVTLEYETLYFLLGMTAAVGLQLPESVRFDWREGVLVSGCVVAFLAAVRVFTALYY